MPRPFEAHRRARLAEVNAKYDAVLAAGFMTADFEDQPEAERLQCRTELDRTNWLGLVVKCQFAIAMDLGDVLEAGTVLRCTSNRMYAITANNALSRMVVLLNQADLAQRNWWRLKDAVRDCARREDLALIDLGEGWP
jgi:hypothetical protein